MNYGEELVYWYLRLNGFFLLSNFVVHQSKDVQYTSDVDLLAIRPPHVFEEVGGQPSDWDEFLAGRLGFGRYIGVVCEVKTGALEESKLFRPEHLRYAVGRLGLVEPKRVDQVAEALAAAPSLETEGDIVIAKLLISSGEHAAGPYLNRTLAQAEDFIAERVRRYPLEKYASRLFFPSQVFQLIISQVYREIKRRKAG